MNEYVVRTGHQENINWNESEPDYDFVGPLATNTMRPQILLTKAHISDSGNLFIPKGRKFRLNERFIVQVLGKYEVMSL